jgi:hypothetical protein
MNTSLAGDDHSSLVVIPAGTDYSAAIAQMLFNAMTSDADYAVDFPETGLRTPELHYRKDSDFLKDAHDLALAIGKRLVRIPHERYRHGVYRLIENDPLDRDLMLKFAWQMGFWDVDMLMSSMTTVQWDEWRAWMKRHA